MLKRFRSRLVDDAGQWHNMASIRLAAAAAALGGAVTSNPELLLALVTFLPVGPMRWAVVALVVVTMFVVPTLTRLWGQEAGDVEED